MKTRRQLRRLSLMGLALAVAIGCAETGPEHAGFNGAGGGGERSGFGTVGNGGASSGFGNGTGEGGASSGFTSNAGEGGTATGASPAGGGGWVCNDFCQFALECTDEFAEAEGEEGLQAYSDIILDACLAYCNCVVGRVAGLGAALDKALNLVTCYGPSGMEFDDRELEQLAAGVDADAIGPAFKECAYQLAGKYGEFGLDDLPFGDAMPEGRSRDNSSFLPDN